MGLCRLSPPVVRWQRAGATHRAAKSLIIDAKGVVAGRGEEPCCESWEAFEVVMERN